MSSPKARKASLIACRFAESAVRRRTGRERAHCRSLGSSASRANPSRVIYVGKARARAARLASTSRRAGSFVCTPALYLPKEPWLAETFESPSPSRARSASGVTTKPRSRSGTIRTGSSSASTAAGVAGTRRTRRPADARAPSRAWHVTVSGPSSARPSAARGGWPTRTGRSDDRPVDRRPDARSSPSPAVSPELAAGAPPQDEGFSERLIAHDPVLGDRPTFDREAEDEALEDERPTRTRPTRRSRTGRSRTPRRRSPAGGAGEAGYEVRGRRGATPRPARTGRVSYSSSSLSGPSFSASSGRTARRSSRSPVSCSASS